MSEARAEDSIDLCLKTIELLIHHGASFDCRDRQGRTPLDIAVEKSNLPMVKFLLEAGADSDRDYGSCGRFEKETSLHLAVSNSSLETIKVLIEYGADASMPDRFGETPAMRAARAGRTEVLAYLGSVGENLKSRDRCGFSALDWAAWSGHEATVTWLLQNAAADPNRGDRLGKTTLHIAVERDWPQVVRTLLLYGANPKLQDCSGNTPVDYVEPNQPYIKDLLRTEL